ncbi:replication initiator protein A [Methylobacterium indicum]|uniref:replication initiator protein A n=1 Tax=Methylobacterium indicum TaxID=1775910 RepID=UPI0009E3AE6D|nr:replication initiator protein A [Methylobacterium indicum]
MKAPATRPAPEGDSQLELFVSNFVDIVFRDQQDLMENPLCSLGKTPRKDPIKYQVGDKFVTVTANSETGMCTIYDHDVLIWAATQIREAQDRGQETSNRLVFHPYNLLKSIRRGTSGRDYEDLKAAMRRLVGTMVETNIRADDETLKRGRRNKASITFNMLQFFGEFNTEDPNDDRWVIVLPDWFYQGVINHRYVLSIDSDYFLLTSGLERWLYRVFRKHAGQQELGWQFTMKQLHTKSGSPQRLSNFALDVRKIIKRLNSDDESNKGLPGYQVSLGRNEEGDELVRGVSRSQLAISDPGFQPKKNPRRRVTQGGINPPQWDNRPFAELVGKRKKAKPSPPDEETLL